MDERIAKAIELYERAVFGGDQAALDQADRELDAAEADLALARGRILHTRFLDDRDEAGDQAAEDPHELPLLNRALHLYQVLRDTAGQAEALFWLGCFYQVVRRDDTTARPLLARSLKLATEAGQLATMSEALRHLGIDAQRAGRLDQAREQLEESCRLRRQTGNLAGVAANQIGLAYIAAAQGRRDDALAVLEEAAALAGQTAAHRVERYVAEARATLSPAP
ncbi:MAG TPA: tetratricopeptide repeat protein [Streptosporangiaceae bacterium]|jgi:tetratricopeptide (TPR) repeat protein